QHDRDRCERLHAYPFVRNQRTAFSIVTSSGVDGKPSSRRAFELSKKCVCAAYRVALSVARGGFLRTSATFSISQPTDSATGTGMRRSGIFMPATRATVR